MSYTVLHNDALRLAFRVCLVLFDIYMLIRLFLDNWHVIFLHELCYSYQDIFCS